MHAGVTTLQEVPQQALGHIMGGGASGGHHSQKQAKPQATTEAAAGDRAAGNSPQRHKLGCRSPDSRRRRHASAVERNQNAVASEDQAEAAKQAGRQPATRSSPGNPESAETKDEAGDASELRGWDKVRKVVKGTPTPKFSLSSQETSASLDSPSSAPSDEVPDSRTLKRSSTSGGSLSKNTRGPMQFMWSRGGKLAAALALMSSRGSKSQSSEEGDIEAGRQPYGNGSSQGPVNAPGDAFAPKRGARDPDGTAGSEVRFRVIQCDFIIVCASQKHHAHNIGFKLDSRPGRGMLQASLSHTDRTDMCIAHSLSLWACNRHWKRACKTCSVVGCISPLT